jgi:hypothetical protein
MKMNLMRWLFLVCLFATPAFAQIETGDISKDNIPLLEYKRPILEYVTGGAFILVVLGIGFKASKRSHAT